MKRKSVLSLLLAISAAVFANAQILPTPDPLARLKFLVGEWEGVGSGVPGEGVGGTSFAFELRNNILVRKNWATYPPKPGETEGISHEDLMFIYPLPGGPSMKAIYFDNEGHVIEYAASFPRQENAVVFESDSANPGPRFKLSYALSGDGKLTVVFSMAYPGGEFKDYARGLLMKKADPGGT
jgi:hypothetical protein